MENFENIRPYNDSELAPAIERITKNSLMKDILTYLYPNGGGEQFENVLNSCESIDDFQTKVVYHIVKRVLNASSDGLTYDGIENVDLNKKYLFISNHRDIVLDSAILQVILCDLKVQTTEIAVGDNLITSPFIEDLIRTNKMIKVIRSGTARDLYTASRTLSKYIRQRISSGANSIWIAQRNGRTKDGLDLTEQGLLKMLDMSGVGDFVKDFSELNILPVSISYEYEPCDIYKAIELYRLKKEGRYVKAKNEDLNSILTGMKQYKGKIHVSFSKPIELSEIELSDQLDKNEKYKNLASIIDDKINSSYKLWKNSYIASDTLNDSTQYKEYYSQEEKDNFVNYIKNNLDKTGLKDKEFEEILLSIYSNPITNKR